MTSRGNSRVVLFGLLVAAVLAGGGLLWWSASSHPPPGDPDVVDPANVYPATLPAGYQPPLQLDAEGRLSFVTQGGIPTATLKRTIHPDVGVGARWRGSVEVCVVPSGNDIASCGRGASDPRGVETTYRDLRVVISPVDPATKSISEWRGIAFTSDYSEMIWLVSQAPK